MEKSMIIRTTLFIYAAVNQLLLTRGYSPLPFVEGDIEQIINLVIGIYSSFEIWRKNNNYTPEAKRAQEKLNKYKAEAKYAKATGGTLSVIKDQPLGADIDIREENY
ncbi:MULTISPECIES: phage holin [Staphylococcus]|uniref:Phage holin n=1 Tax=Staphylococcus hyicus TaxID=1284 RepID=A0ACD5FN83_STAHY|nr:MULTISPECIES: phage holin [Staphylococcus]AJC95726.1 SPP1 family phage holin [Staphylococcus hyicus]MCQ9301336.1 phage holin [Staphylococcus hyicus]MDG4943996.1 phage holin [Staphylococcus agnetis]MDP4448380.1 phage holin [Staphylococcus hyicus]MDP4459703.1 phage holin [Staphylococcus hyicus]